MKLKKIKNIAAGIFICAVTGCTSFTNKALTSMSAAALGHDLAVLDALNRGDIEKAKFLLNMSADGGIVALNGFRERGILDPIQLQILGKAIAYRKKHPLTGNEYGIDRSVACKVVREILLKEYTIKENSQPTKDSAPPMTKSGIE